MFCNIRKWKEHFPSYYTICNYNVVNEIIIYILFKTSKLIVSFLHLIIFVVLPDTRE